MKPDFGIMQCESVKQEAMDVVVQLLVSSFPDRFQFEGQNLLNTATGEVWELHNSNKNPMEIIARLVQACHAADWSVMHWFVSLPAKACPLCFCRKACFCHPFGSNTADNQTT